MKINKLKKIFALPIIVSSAYLSSCDDSNDYIKLNKTEYLRNEDILVTAKGPSGSWVGLYRENDVIGEDQSIYWYYVNDGDHASGSTYSIKHQGHFNESRSTLKDLPPYNYKMVYFTKDYEETASISFKIGAKKLAKPLAPLSGTYNLTDPSSGLAGGSLSLTFDTSSVLPTDVIMYWANEKGKLEGYSSLPKAKIQNYTSTIEFAPRSIIPEGATSLWVYSSNGSGTSKEPLVITLPENSSYQISEEPLVRYSIVSDVHIATEDSHLASSDAKALHDEHFLAMLDDVKEFNDDALIINGDIANSGSENEWIHLQSLLSQRDNLPNIYYSIGNHDLYGGDYDKESKLFKKYTGLSSVYYEREINGYTHIFLGSEDSSKSSVDAYLSEEQLTWFEGRLDALDSNKPIFVYLHQSLYNTVAGSLPGQGWNGVTQDEELRSILSKHKNVLFWNGHSHWDMNSESNMYVKDESLGNIFNTSSVAYLWSSYYFKTGEYMKGSQGYEVEIYKDKILVLGREYDTGEWIPGACYSIDI